MAWPNQNKSFQQRFRVFSSAFWQNNNDNSFDLEKSDKIVLPPSALNTLTNCNASFPVLLKIECIDKGSNTALASNIFSYVMDYSSPEGLIYMSSWMISKLNLEPSGQSVVELKLPTSNNLKYQCPTADFLQLQPHSLQLMLQDDITNLVHKSLKEYYSSLRINDEITVYSKTKEYKLSVIKISGKDTKYKPKCVRLDSNDIENSLMLGFSEPKNYDLDDDYDDKKENNKEKKENDKENDESDEEWEIVSVDKVKSISDLSWKEPINDKDNAINNDKDDDIKIAPRNEPVIEDNNDASNAEEEPPKEEPKEEEVECTEWLCPKCESNNEIQYKFCPKCGCSKQQWKPPIIDKKEDKKEDKPKENKEKEDKKTENEICDVVLKKVSVINDGTYSPNEERQTGWIVKNISNKEINIAAKLIKFAGNNDVILKYNEKIQFQMKPNDEMFILIEVCAPSIPNQYHMFCQLLNENGKRICEVLSLPVIVKSEFGDTKEKQIKQIYDMGFNDRNKIITALKKWNWDDLKAINWLATH